MKKLLSLALAAAAALTLTACSSKPQEVELHIFAAASMTETMDQIIENYKSEVPNVTIIPTYDSSGTLLTQIQEGADCDLFISAAQTQMNTLYEEGGLLADTRLDLLENGALTYGSNVKEVTTQVSEATVDCGIIYGTDAASAGLTVADTATAEMCGQVIYPAAVLGNSQHPDEAKAFLAYLQTDACAQIFEGVGFSPIQ